MSIAEKFKFVVARAKAGDRLAQAALAADAVIYGGIIVTVLYVVFS